MSLKRQIRRRSESAACPRPDRTTWNYQFTRRLTLRAILDFRTTCADPALTTLESRRNSNGDLLLVYLVNDSRELFVKASYLSRF